MYHVPDNCGGGSFPIKEYATQHIQHSHTTKTNDVVNRYNCAVKHPEKSTMIAALAMLCAPVAALRAPFCCRSPWPPQRPSPLDPPLRTCSRCRCLFQSDTLLLRPNKKVLLAAFGSDPAILFIAQGGLQGGFNPPLPRSSTLSLHSLSSSNQNLLRARLPQRKPRPRRRLARGGSCLRAQTSRLCIAALPLLPKKDARIVSVRA